MSTPRVKPSKKEIEIARTYWHELDLYSNVNEGPMCEELLIDTVPMALRIIARLGDGDPKEAARKHAMVVRKFYQPANNVDTIH